MKQKIKIERTEGGNRIDSFLAKYYPDSSRSYLANKIKIGEITVNSKRVKPSYLLSAGDEIVLDLEDSKKSNQLIPQKIELNIIYEDNDVIVINKQPGIVVHPGAGNKDNTIANALLNYFPDIKDAVFEENNLISEGRPGIVHRLDKDTSGVMIIAKNKRAMHSLARQIQNRTVQKEYVALCYGWPKNSEGHLVNYLGRHSANRKIMAEVGKEKGKEAISDYEVEKYLAFKDHHISLVRFTIHTGRTHQIRVQSKMMGTPVMGDLVYGTKESMKLSLLLGLERQMLHANRLTITLPGENKARTFIAPIPTDLENALDQSETKY